MLNTPPHLEACRPRGLFSIFHGTSSPVARRCPRASDLVLSAEHAFLLYERPGLHLQSGASAVGGVLRGARRAGAPPGSHRTDFNPRTPCGVRQGDAFLAVHAQEISIHAPRAGCDQHPGRAAQAGRISIHAPRAGCDRHLCDGGVKANDFNPRTPCGVRLPCRVQARHPRRISIHAPRAGCDPSGRDHLPYTANFNPRTPCGVRRCIV